WVGGEDEEEGIGHDVPQRPTELPDLVAVVEVPELSGVDDDRTVSRADLGTALRAGFRPEPEALLVDAARDAEDLGPGAPLAQPIHHVVRSRRDVVRAHSHHALESMEDAVLQARGAPHPALPHELAVRLVREEHDLHSEGAPDQVAERSRDVAEG